MSKIDVMLVAIIVMFVLYIYFCTDTLLGKSKYPYKKIELSSSGRAMRLLYSGIVHMYGKINNSIIIYDGDTIIYNEVRCPYKPSEGITHAETLGNSWYILKSNNLIDVFNTTDGKISQYSSDLFISIERYSNGLRFVKANGYVDILNIGSIVLAGNATKLSFNAPIRTYGDDSYYASC